MNSSALPSDVLNLNRATLAGVTATCCGFYRQLNRHGASNDDRCGDRRSYSRRSRIPAETRSQWQESRPKWPDPTWVGGRGVFGDETAWLLNNVYQTNHTHFCKYLAGQVWFFTLWNHYFFLRVCNRKKLCYGLKQKLHSEFSLIPVVPTQVIQMMNIIIVP